MSSNPMPDSFDPDTIWRLVSAFEDAWESFTKDGLVTEVDTEVVRQLLAEGILAVAKLGERDQQQLREAALAHLAGKLRKMPPAA